MARRGQRQSATRTQPRQRRARDLDNEGIIPVLARAVREVEASAERGRVQPSGRTKFQVIALLVREERARVKADDLSEAQRTGQLKRLDGVATILAKTAARDTSLLQLLDEEAVVSDSAKALKRDMVIAAGIEPPEEEPEPDRDRRAGRHQRASGGTPVGQGATAGQPVPHPRLLQRRHQQLLTSPARHLGAARTAVPGLRAGLGRSVLVHGAARADLAEGPARPRADEAPGRRSSRPPLPATAPSCSPTSPASARPHRRCSPRRQRTPSRSWPSYPTWSRPTGPARPGSGRRSTR